MLFNQNILKHILKTDLAEELLWWLNYESNHYPIWEIDKDTKDGCYVYEVDDFKIVKVNKITVLEIETETKDNLTRIHMLLKIDFVTRYNYIDINDKEIVEEIDDSAEFYSHFDYKSRWHKKYKHFMLEYRR